jgi:integrase
MNGLTLPSIDGKRSAGCVIGRVAGQIQGGADDLFRQGHLRELVRRLAPAAGIETWTELSPHSLRHSAITLALEVGDTLSDVQEHAGHTDPRTTGRYDHAWDTLGRNAA